MKATIDFLWDTGIELITFDNSDTERPTSISDLKNCENVLIGDKIPKTRMTQVLIDNQIHFVEPRKIQHPSGGGSMYILEIM